MFSFVPGFEEPYDSDAFFFHEPHNKFRTIFLADHDVYVHHRSVPLIIPARETVHVTVGFRATVTTLKSVFMYIRNNLTILEVVRLSGQGAHPSFKFGNRKPGSILPLLFELTEKHLRDCEKEKNRKNPAPNLTVKRSFTARNTGDIPVMVHAFYINGFLCEGYGFKVLNCAPFELAPNATRKIDIAFTPDFTLSKIQRTLILHTSLNLPVNYTLITTVPPYFLAPCASVLARPSWEPLLYYACVSLMLFLLFIVVSICFIESDRILKTSIQIRDDVSTQPLDLRLIGTQTRNEIRSHKSEMESEWSTNQMNKPLHKDTSRNTSDASLYLMGKSGSWSSEQNSKESSSSSNVAYNKYDDTVNHTNKVIKKKLNKKNSNNTIESIVTENAPHEMAMTKKSSWSSVFSRAPQQKQQQQQPEVSEGKKSPVVVSKSDNLVKRIATMKSDPKKKCNNNSTNAVLSKKVKTPDLPCSEEETSSTTTESSNNDDIDKCNSENTTPKPEKLKKPIASKSNKSPNATTNCDFRDNYEGDGEDEDFEKDSSNGPSSTNNVSRWKSRSETNKAAKDSHEHKQHSSSESPRSNDCPRKINKNNNRERKEKNLQKRKSSDRNASNKISAHNNEMLNISSFSNNIRVSPPIPPAGVWGENRATFSDVVARSDSTFYSPQPSTSNPRPVATQSHSTNAKPTLYVEPTQKQKEVKVSNAELGPIGTKKSEAMWTPESTKPNYSNIQINSVKPMSTSFFTEPQHALPGVDNPNSYFDVPEIWSSPENAMNLFSNSATEPEQDLPTLSTFHGKVFHFM